eukprot:COSAG05_NODE_893_length_6708_cov_2.153427_2_plen_82_part_00
MKPQSPAADHGFYQDGPGAAKGAASVEAPAQDENGERKNMARCSPESSHARWFRAPSVLCAVSHTLNSADARDRWVQQVKN